MTEAERDLLLAVAQSIIDSGRRVETALIRKAFERVLDERAAGAYDPGSRLHEIVNAAKAAT